MRIHRSRSFLPCRGRGLLLRLLLRHVTLERSLLLLERVQLRNPVDDVRVLVDLAAGPGGSVSGPNEYSP